MNDSATKNTKTGGQVPCLSGVRLAIKSTSGKVVCSSARETKRECIEDYISTLIKTGVMVERVVMNWRAAA